MADVTEGPVGPTHQFDALELLGQQLISISPIKPENCRKISTEIKRTLAATSDDKDPVLINVKGKLATLAVSYQDLACDVANYVLTLDGMCRAAVQQLPFLGDGLLRPDDSERTRRTADILERVISEVQRTEEALQTLRDTHTNLHGKVATVEVEAKNEYNGAVENRERMQKKIDQNFRTARENIDEIGEAAADGAKAGGFAGAALGGLLGAALILSGPIGWVGGTLCFAGTAAIGAAAGAGGGATGNAIISTACVVRKEAVELSRKSDVAILNKKAGVWAPVVAVITEVVSQLEENQKALSEVKSGLTNLHSRVLAGKGLRPDPKQIVPKAHLWNQAACRDWASGLGFGTEFETAFAKEAIDGVTLLADIDEQVAKEFGLNGLKVKRFLRSIEDLKLDLYSPEVTIVIGNLEQALSGLSVKCNALLEKQESAADRIEYKATQSLKLA